MEAKEKQSPRKKDPVRDSAWRLFPHLNLIREAAELLVLLLCHGHQGRAHTFGTFLNPPSLMAELTQMATCHVPEHLIALWKLVSSKDGTDMLPVVIEAQSLVTCC